MDNPVYVNEHRIRNHENVEHVSTAVYPYPARLFMCKALAYTGTQVNIAGFLFVQEMVYAQVVYFSFGMISCPIPYLDTAGVLRDNDHTEPLMLSNRFL